jgi:hypothetical protein
VAHTTKLASEDEINRGMAFLVPIVKKYQRFADKHKHTLERMQAVKNRRPVNNLNALPYEHNRVLRALLFLQMVRSADTLVIKLTFYIAILECLFTSTNSELTHQVSERTALFIGGNNERMKDTYKRVKTGYSVRSSYVHGDNVKLKPDEQLLNSQIMDTLIRTIILKVFENDYIFMLDNKTKGYKDIYDDYWKDILFK